MLEKEKADKSIRFLPRPFQFHWGKGTVVEEASIKAPYNEPTIQLLEYDDGSLSVRFCYYQGTHFGRGSLMMDEISIEEMRDALQSAPRLYQLLTRMVN